MRTLKTLSTRQVVGVTCAQRTNKDGSTSVAVLFDDDQISWYKTEDFNSTFEVV